MNDEKKPVTSSVNRRDFLKTATAITTMGGNVPMVEKIITANISAIAAPTPLTPTHLLLNGFGQAYAKFLSNDEVNNYSHTFQDFFGYGAAPSTSDAFFTRITGQIDHLYDSAATFTGYLRKLQDLKEPAMQILTPAFADINDWCNWNHVMQSQSLIKATRKWIDSAGSAESKMALLKECYANTLPSPLQNDSIDWSQPAGNILAKIDSIMAGMEKTIEEKRPEDAIHSIPQQENGLAHSFLKLLYEQQAGLSFFRESQQRAETALAAIKLKHRLNENMLFCDNDSIKL